MGTERSNPGVHIQVGLRQFRAELKTWLDRVRGGDEIIVTDRGRPVARLVPAGRSSVMERLIADGRVTPARGPRIRLRPEDAIPARGSVSDLIKEQRR